MSSSTDALSPAAATAAPALRVSRPGWRDPRLWIGVVLVAVCVVAGARIVGSAEDTVLAWAVVDQEGAGASLGEQDLRPVRVHFADAGDLDAYFRTTDELPTPLELTSSVGAGELLPRSAVAAGNSGLTQVPLSVDPGQVPPAVEAGSMVDVHVATPGVDRPRPAAPVLTAVSVVASVPPGESFSATGLQQVIVAVPEDDVRGYFRAIRSVDSPVITIVRRG